ncbi:hypothetical protein Plhal304r1_c012g0045551 [Plasmopara halstedii]
MRRHNGARSAPSLLLFSMKAEGKKGNCEVNNFKLSAKWSVNKLLVKIELVCGE